MATVSQHVDKGTGYAPLNELMAKAMALFGDGTYESHDGSLPMMLLIMANMIVAEVNQHPYMDDLPQIDEYGDLTDVRSIPDLVMITGLAGMYASQQNSQKTGLLMGQYYRLMNQLLWGRRNGNTPLEVRITDRASSKNDPSNGIGTVRSSPQTRRGRTFYPANPPATEE